LDSTRLTFLDYRKHVNTTILLKHNKSPGCGAGGGATTGHGTSPRGIGRRARNVHEGHEGYEGHESLDKTVIAVATTKVMKAMKAMKAVITQ